MCVHISGDLWIGKGDWHLKRKVADVPVSLVVLLSGMGTNEVTRD